VNVNLARELVCIIAKIKQRDIMVAGNLLLASSALGNEKSSAEMLRSFLDNVFVNNEVVMRDHDEALRRELDLMNQVNWGKVLSIPEYMENQIGISTSSSRDGETIEDLYG